MCLCALLRACLSTGLSPLLPFAAALNGHASVVELLVAAGADCDTQSQNGSSALHNAASGAHCRRHLAVNSGAAGPDCRPAKRACHLCLWLWVISSS
jgi:hypothetical protein